MPLFKLLGWIVYRRSRRVCRPQRESENSWIEYTNYHKLVPLWNGIRASMVAFFSLQYKLLHRYSDDGRHNTSWEVFVCVARNLTVTTACLLDMASLLFWIYVLLKQNVSHLPPVILILLTLFVWPCGLKQWNTKEVSSQITIYILSSEREALIVNPPFLHQSLSDCVCVCVRLSLCLLSFFDNFSSSLHTRKRQESW